MEFRRTGSSDDRRRRVLRDDIVSGSEDDAGKKDASSRRDSNRRYNDGAATARQPRITDFIPRRAFALLVPALLLLTAIAAIQAAYTTAAVRGFLSHDARFAPFNPVARGSLATWFASMLLAGSAALCWVIYRVRMHRVDDFRGRYRVWIVAAVALAWAAMDVGTGLNHALSAFIELLTGKPLFGVSHGWWLVIYLVAFGALAVRMLIEIRQCRPAMLGLVGAAFWLMFGTSLLTELLVCRDPVERNVAESSFFLLGYSCLALSVLSYSRHVFLDAQGMLTATGALKQKKKKPKAKEEPAEEADKADAKAKTPAPAAKSNAPAGKKEDDDEDEDEDSPTVGMSGGGPLSKSERKKLKKMQPQQQRRAA